MFHLLTVLFSDIIDIHSSYVSSRYNPKDLWIDFLLFHFPKKSSFGSQWSKQLKWILFKRIWKGADVCSFDNLLPDLMVYQIENK